MLLGVPYIDLHRRDGSVAATVEVDEQDFDELNALSWYLGSRGYAMRQYREPTDPPGQRRCRAEMMHRRIMGLQRGDPLEVDHVNEDKLDNRRCNLRVVTHAENEQNKTTIRAQSGARHVHWVKARGYWKVCIVVEGKQHVREGFRTVAEAADAAVEMRAHLQPFSRL